MHDQQPVPTIVVSRPGVMQQALRTSLSVCPAVEVMASAGDGLTALRLIEAHCPGLIVVDANLLPEESEALVATFKASRPQARCLVFVQSLRHELMMTAAGADAVMLRDEPADNLQAVLARLTGAGA